MTTVAGTIRGYFILLAFALYIPSAFLVYSLHDGSAERERTIGSARKSIALASMKITARLADLKDFAQRFSTSPTMITSVEDFSEGAYLIDSDLAKAGVIMLDRFGREPEDNPTEEPDEKLSLYKQELEKYDRFFTDVAKANHFIDISLAEPDHGFILYSSQRSRWFARKVLAKDFDVKPVSKAVAEGLSGYFYFSGFFKERDSAFVSFPLKEGDQVVGTIVAEIPKGDIVSAVHKIDTLFDDVKLVVTGTRGQIYPATKIALPAGLMKQDEGTIKSAREENLYFVHTSELFDTQLKIVAIAPVSSAKFDLNNSLLLLALLLVFLSAAWFLSSMVTGRLGTQINTFADSMRKVAVGEKITSEPAEEKTENPPREFVAMLDILCDISGRHEEEVKELKQEIKSLLIYVDQMEEEVKRSEGSEKRVIEIAQQTKEEATRTGEKKKFLETETTHLRKRLHKTAERLAEEEEKCKNIAGQYWPAFHKIITQTETGSSMPHNVAEELKQMTDRLFSTLAGIRTTEPENFVKVDFGSVIQKSIALFDKKMEKKNITLTAKITGDMEVRGSAADLVHSIACLLDNAIRYSEEKSTLILTTKKSHGKISVSIRDKAPKIDDETASKMYDLLYRGEPAKNKSRGGLGLGLYVAKKTAIAHDGEIEYKRAEDGNIFTLSLPDFENSNQPKIPGF